MAFLARPSNRRPTTAQSSGSPTRPNPRWRVRLGWLLLLWAGGVAAVTAVAWLLKAVMRLVGLGG